jgi:hypothetical protein
MMNWLSERNKGTDNYNTKLTNDGGVELELVSEIYPAAITKLESQKSLICI